MRIQRLRSDSKEVIHKIVNRWMFTYVRYLTVTNITSFTLGEKQKTRHFPWFVLLFLGNEQLDRT